MWESWRSYISFVLVGAIFILCQALSGGVPVDRAEDVSAAPGDRSYRDGRRDETSGRGDMSLPGGKRPMVPSPSYAGAREDQQTD
jgi:hypothetical protein